MRLLMLFVYYSIVRFLPKSTFPILGFMFKWIRYKVCKYIFKKCGKNCNIENLAYFGDGKDIELGDYCGFGTNCRVPSNIKMGNYVMMAPDVLILNVNHHFENLDIPMHYQGLKEKSQLVIGDDVWIGTRVIILPSVKRIGNGVIIGAGSVVTKDVQDFSIIAGNPAKIIKFRKS